MKLIKYSDKLIWLLILLFFSLVSYIIEVNASQKSNSAQSSFKLNKCTTAQKISIATFQSGYIIICNKEVYVGDNITDSLSDYRLIESDQTFPDIFSYNNLSIILTVESFPKNKPQFVALVGHYDTGLTYKQAIGIYRITDSGVTRAFKRGFNDVTGRWTGFEFSDTKPEFTVIGDLGTLGCGGCRIDWQDFYIWSADTNEFVLNNTSHTAEYKILLDKYNAYSLDGAAEESKQTFSRTKDIINKILSGINVTYTAL